MNNCSCHTLTKEESLILDLINKIVDPEERREAITQYIQLAKPKPRRLVKPNHEEYSLSEILKRVNKKETEHKELTINELKQEINEAKTEIQQLKNRIRVLKMVTDFSKNKSDNGFEEELEFNKLIKDSKVIPSKEQPEPSEENHLNIINRAINQKWYTLVKIIVKNESSFQSLALIDSGADLNFINKGLVPTKYFNKTTQILNTADGSRLMINYKLSDAAVCNNGNGFDIPFIMVNSLSPAIILRTPFLNLLYPITIDNTGISANLDGHQIKFDFIEKPKVKENNNMKQIVNHKEKILCHLKAEIKYKQIEDQLLLPEIKQKIEQIKKQIEQQIRNDLPNAFWNRKKHVVSLPYEEGFVETKIPTKARPIQMNSKLLEISKQEIDELLKKGLIRQSSSPWSCATFYEEKASEKERRVPRLVINYKPLNKV
ncbi:hypothetical protein AMTRI_Chr03g142890 [Amborella trichopoda]